MNISVVGWLPNPTERGTLNLVWSCAITIFACTWTVLHLNVPARKDSAWTRLLRKVKWMIVNLVFPEFLFSKAICDLYWAVKELKELGGKVKKTNPDISDTRTDEYDGDRGPWSCSWEVDKAPLESLRHIFRSLRHIFRSLPHKVRSWLARGKFAASDIEKQERIFPSGTTSVDHESPKGGKPPRPKWTLVHSYYSQMGGFVYQSLDNDFTVCYPTSDLNWKWEAGARKDAEHPLSGLILEKEDIEDKSNLDWLSKGFAMLQVAWVILSVIIRHATHLPVTQLEISTVASSIMAVLIYLANWWKPQDVSRSTIVSGMNPQTPQISCSPERRLSFLRWILTSEPKSILWPKHRVPNDAVWLGGSQPLMLYLMSLSSLVFGGLHCLAWYSEFPTRVELVCWRTASLISAVLPSVPLIFSIMPDPFVNDKVGKSLFTELNNMAFCGRLDFLVWTRIILDGGSSHPFLHQWEPDAQIACISMSKENRNWREKPTPKSIDECKKNKVEWKRAESALWSLIDYHERLRKFLHVWLLHENKASLAAGGYSLWDDTRRFWWEQGECLRAAWKSSREIGLIEFWKDYEDMLSHDSGEPVLDLNVPYIQKVLEAIKKAQDLHPFLRRYMKICSIFSRVATISAMILYAIARLTIIVLLFTTLRSMPAGVYESTPWTRFLPSMS